MRSFLIFSTVFLFSSCALVKEFRLKLPESSAPSYVGLDPKQVVDQLGSPSFKMLQKNREIYVYNSGFVEFTNNIVTKNSNYHPIFEQSWTLNSYVNPGEDVLAVLDRLGAPQYIDQRDSHYFMKYNNGAVYSHDFKVTQVLEKAYNKGTIWETAVSSFTDSSAKDSGKYFLLPGDKSVNPEDLQFKEVKVFLTSALKKLNYNIVEDIDKADYVVLVNYGVSDPKEDIQVISRPVFVPTYTPGKVTNVYSNYGLVGSVQTQGTWGTQYAGQTTHTYTSTTYNRWLNIEAIDFKFYQKHRSLKPVWKVLTSSVGGSDDLRYTLPALCYNTSSFVNKDSQRVTNLVVESDKLNMYLYETKFKNSVNSPRGLAGSR